MKCFFAFLAILAPFILADRNPDWIVDTIDTVMVPEGLAFNKTNEYLEANLAKMKFASLGCTETAFIREWNTQYTIKSANFPDTIGPGEACNFNFMIPELWADLKHNIYMQFYCHTFQLNTNDKYGCGKRGLHIWNDEYENVICDANFNTSTSLFIPLAGNLSIDYIPGHKLKGGAFDCTIRTQAK